MSQSITIQDIIDGVGEGRVFPEHWDGLIKEHKALVQGLDSAYNRCDKAAYEVLIGKFREFIATDIGYEIDKM